MRQLRLIPNKRVRFMLNKIREEAGGGETELALLLTMALAALVSFYAFGGQLFEIYRWMIGQLPF